MLTMSDYELKLEARNKGYRPEMLEKVYRLLDLLEQLMAVPYIADRLVLKGGTAINLFCTDEFPRLSVDLDFNYVGAADRTIMQQERQILEETMLDICRRRQFGLHRNPQQHAGGKTVLVYQSLMGTKGRLEIDLNYVYRVPLWEPTWRTSPAWPKSTNVRVLDIHELAAGKLHALLGREASRDLFDSHQLLTKWPLETEKLRTAFTVYAGMSKIEWREINIDKVHFTVKDIRDKLLPVLRNSEIPGTTTVKIEKWAKTLTEECKSELSNVLPFRENEIEFLDRLQGYGEIRPDLISRDSDLCERINQHPLLIWRAKHVLK